MPPLDRRRRRRRRIAPWLLVTVAVAVVLAVLIGGVFQVGRASGPYESDINRSYAAQGSVVIGQSNATGAQLRSLMAGMTGLSRSALRSQLDSLASDSTAEATSAAGLSPPPPTVGGFPEALADRAKGVAELRSAVDGVIGSGPSGRAVLASDQAVAQITAAGALLMRADRTYAAVRRGFLVAPGAAILPRSRWVTDPSTWSAGPVQTLVQELAGSTSLTSVQRVVLEPGTVHIVPAAVPPVKPGGPSVVLPTTSLQVSAVVSNEGNVAVPGVTVKGAVTPQGPGRSDTTSTRVTLAPGDSVAVTLPPLGVTPGTTYTLAVSVNPPTAQSDRSQTSATYSIRIAPPTPPTTTTTTTTTTRPPTSTTAKPTTTTRPASTTHPRSS
jgi:hypothetical protein